MCVCAMIGNLLWRLVSAKTKENLEVLPHQTLIINIPRLPGRYPFFLVDGRGPKPFNEGSWMKPQPNGLLHCKHPSGARA